MWMMPDRDVHGISTLLGTLNRIKSGNFKLGTKVDKIKAIEAKVRCQAHEVVSMEWYVEVQWIV